MEISPKITIHVAQLLAPIISSRDIAEKLKDAITKAESQSVDLDFAEVEFISRSAAHALLLMKEDLSRKFPEKKHISFINTSKDVKEMLRIIAANRALPKDRKPDFEAERISIDSLLKKIPA